MAEQRFPLLGYTTSIDVLDPAPTGSSKRNNTLLYHGKPYLVRKIYTENEEQIRNESPDMREFLMTRANGNRALIKGYRGTGAPGKRRALPACDARLLVNLTSPGDRKGRLLDPFAGAGSVVQHAIKSGFAVSSCDLDESVTAGLAHLGSTHRTADARKLPFDSSSFEAIATEPPFDRRHGRAAISSLPELFRVLSNGGRLAILCARWQTRDLLATAQDLSLTELLNCPIDRKGLNCTVLLWQKA